MTEDELKMLNNVLIIIGAMIIIYFISKILATNKILKEQIKECKKDIRELRTYIFKPGRD
jgi:uncharacterized membrane protein (DUF106 family)